MTGHRFKMTLAIGGGVTAVSFLTAMGLLWTARNVSGFADLYVRNVYPVWVNTLGRFWGMLPFSAVEFLLYGMLIFILTGGLWKIVRVIGRKKRVCEALAESGLFLMTTASVLFLIYVLNCGINYSAMTFSDTYGFERNGYTVEQLAQVCQKLTGEVLALSEQLALGNDGAALADGGQTDGAVLSAGGQMDGTALSAGMTNTADWAEEAVRAMKKLGSEYPTLDINYPRPKGLVLSEILSYQQLSGVYSPFTVEANYNADMTAYNIPFTMCHELSHLCGYMQEDEANFIAWLACCQADAPEFNYSGALMGWIYCTNELYKVDKETWAILYGQLPESVKSDLLENNRFWDSYEGTVAEASQQVNDTYLKAHKQSEGIKTYDRIVDLIVNYYG